MCKKFSVLRFLFLAPLSVIYKIIGDIRNFFYENGILKSKEYDLPIISVGNISVGGTGKTPHVEYFVRMLKDNCNVAVLSRGYKRKTKGFRIVEASDDYLLTGDEPLQIKQKFNNIVVAVCESRTKGVEKLRELYPDLNLIILDDAFQHRKINPGLHILLNNYNHPISKDFVLPLGSLRESRSGIHRAHLLIYTNCPSNLKPIERRILTKEMEVLPYQSLFFSKIVYQNIEPIFDCGLQPIKLDSLKDYNVLSFTGIAHPEALFKTIENKAKSIISISYPDHHKFTRNNIGYILKKFDEIHDKKIIIVTEKDAVKLKNSNFFDDESKKYIYCIPVKVELLCSEEEEQQFNNQIFTYVRNNKRYSNLYRK